MSSQPTGVRRLVIVRHAKAEPYNGQDHGRSLTAAGHRAAASLGRLFADRGISPDYALVSTATRTRQTWAGIEAAVGVRTHVELSDDLYHAGPEDVIEAARWVPAQVRTLVYVGHNPTAGELPHLLDDGTGEGSVLNEIAVGYPTGAAAVVEVPGSWAELRMGGGRVTDLFVGSRD